MLRLWQADISCASGDLNAGMYGFGLMLCQYSVNTSFVKFFARPRLP